MQKPAYIYILASKKNGALYVGVTTDLVKRIHEHKTGAADGFTKDLSIKRLVYFEIFDDVSTAIAREKTLKKWRRQWKINLIEKDNPDWNDLYTEICR